MNRLNYPGAKGGQGIRAFLLNYIPISRRYFSLFYGKGSFENLKVFENIQWICSEKNQDLQSFSTATAKVVYFDYKKLVDDFNFTSDDFIFCDPPYMLSTRTSGRSYYKHEFTDEMHIDFLETMRMLKCRILITHPKCAMYDEMLNSWNCIEFSYQTRAGLFNDAVYFNYDVRNLPLITYDFLGANRTERQQIKRQRANFVKKMKSLSFHERQSILNALDQNNLLQRYEQSR